MVSGYSTTPQLKKLGIVDGKRWDVVGESSNWSFEIVPDAATRVETGPADVLLAFFRAAADLDAQVGALAERIRPAGALWVAWPRKAAGHTSDITENLIREVVLPQGLVDVKVAAIDEDWSGLKIVWRLSSR
jgi:hypothetical protein